MPASARRGAEDIANPQLQSRHCGDLARVHGGRADDPARTADGQLGDPSALASGDPQSIPYADLPAPQPNPRPPLACFSVDREHRAGGWLAPTQGIAGGISHGSTAVSCPTPAPVIAEPHSSGVTRPARMPRRRAASTSPSVGALPGPRDTAANSCSSASAAVSSTSGTHRSRTRTSAARDPCAVISLSTTRSPVRRRRTCRSTRPTSAPTRSILLTKSTVGTPQPPQGAPQDDSLRLHPLDGGKNEHRGVQDGERPLDFGDEVGMPGSVDDIDEEVADRERRHGRTERDPAPRLQLEAVGLGGAVVDTPERADGPGRDRGGARSGWSYRHRHARALRG